MRRTTSRSSSRSGARRASSSRSKRSKRAARPRLSTRQVREIFGVLLMLGALLGVLAILSHAGSILGGIRDGMVGGFGSAWFVPVVAAIALSAYLLWPKAPRPRGIAGPFDRYCGFCGHEMVQGEKRPLWWRLWFLAALLPVAAGLAYGIAQAQVHH